jgi:hypothetical protein
MGRKVHWRLITLRTFDPEERINSSYVGTEQRDELIRRIDLDDAARLVGMDPEKTVCVGVSYMGFGSLEDLNYGMPE